MVIERLRRMIIEIPNENSIVKWKNDDKDEWKYAEISDLIKAYERPQGDWILNKDENPECPFCHHSFTYWGNFCGNCGANMR